MKRNAIDYTPPVPGVSASGLAWLSLARVGAGAAFVWRRREA